MDWKITAAKQRTINKFEKHGYTYDALESYWPGYIHFFGQPGDALTFESWKDARAWIKNVIFD